VIQDEKLNPDEILSDIIIKYNNKQTRRYSGFEEWEKWRTIKKSSQWAELLDVYTEQRSEMRDSKSLERPLHDALNPCNATNFFHLSNLPFARDHRSIPTYDDYQEIMVQKEYLYRVSIIDITVKSISKKVCLKGKGPFLILE